MQRDAASGSQPIADARSWRDLIIVVIIAAVTVHFWHRALWVWGAVVAFLFLRAGAYVLAARAAGADPEERLREEAEEKAD